MEILKSIIEKISQYNFLTNIIPGTVICIILKYLIGYDIIVADNFYLTGIVFYVAGIVNGRVGSIVVEPILKKTRLITFTSYEDFIQAEKKDAKITVLNQENNVYRSYISVAFVSLMAFSFRQILTYSHIEKRCETIIILVLLLILFICSYKKQTGFIVKRVKKNISGK